MYSRTLRYGVLWLSALAAIRLGVEAQPQIEIPLMFDDGGRYVALAGVVRTVSADACSRADTTLLVAWPFEAAS